MPVRRIDTSIRYSRQVGPPPSGVATTASPVTPGETSHGGIPYEPYIASAELEQAVNLAIALGRPLLLQGDPGSGKTRLAYALSYSLGLPLEQAYVKSTSRGQDLLYTYDPARRLYDIQTATPGVDTAASDPSRYITLGPLGRAIKRAQYNEQRSVVLIDEVDKADLDFPNDLLHELDQLAFRIAEVPDDVYAVPEDRPDLRPIIVVTNNEEKALPDAFLRRCVFHYLSFPANPQDLERILTAHRVGDGELTQVAVDTLTKLRELDLAKKPGLSELLDWVQYMTVVGTPPKTVSDLPYSGALIKHREDQVKVERWSPQP